MEKVQKDCTNKMAKKKIDFDFAKEDADLDALGKKIGITDEDKADVASLRTGRPAQSTLAKESAARDSRRASASTEIKNLASIPVGQPDVGLEGRIRSTVDSFKKEPPGPKKEAHRRMAWTLAEGIKRDSNRGEGSSSDLTPGRRTRATFVPGLDMPCVTPGPNGMGCNNTVPYQGPKVEAEGSPVTAGITTCSGGKCDIPAAVAPRSAER